MQGNSNSIIKKVFGVTPKVDGKEVNVKQVLVIGETAHNDYNWTDTFENYYSKRFMAKQLFKRKN
jgi:hypothetical protein